MISRWFHIISHMENPDDTVARALLSEKCKNAVVQNIENFEDLSEEVKTRIDTFIIEGQYKAGLKMRTYSDQEWDDLDNEIDRGLKDGKNYEEIMEGKNEDMQEWIQAKKLRDTVNDYWNAEAEQDTEQTVETEQDTEQTIEAEQGDEENVSQIQDNIIRGVTKLQEQMKRNNIEPEQAVIMLKNITRIFEEAAESQ